MIIIIIITIATTVTATAAAIIFIFLFIFVLLFLFLLWRSASYLHNEDHCSQANIWRYSNRFSPKDELLSRDHLGVNINYMLLGGIAFHMWMPDMLKTTKIAQLMKMRCITWSGLLRGASSLVLLRRARMLDKWIGVRFADELVFEMTFWLVVKNGVL